LKTKIRRKSKKKEEEGEGDGGEDEEVCRVLEGMWRRPDEAVQLNAQSLIGRGHGLADQKVGERKKDGTSRRR
jgi:hypothetical protein